MKTFLIIFLGIFLSFKVAYGGVEATMQTLSNQKGQKHVITGKFFAEGQRIRLDQNVIDISQSTIVDYFSKKVLVLLHSRKLYVETILNDVSWRERVMRGQIPSIQEAEKLGFQMKKIADEEISGFACQGYFLKWKEGENEIQMKMWVSKDLEGGIPLKTETKTSNGLEQVSTLYQIHKKPLEDELFQIPIDYAHGEHTIIGLLPEN